jgi:hypothetical protein
MENPEHKESAEEFLKAHIDKAGEFFPYDKVLHISAVREYAQLAVKEAREQDIKEMEEKKVPIKYRSIFDVDHNKGIDECISILESKLEGGETK